MTWQWARLYLFIYTATQQRTRFSDYTYHYQLCKLGNSYFGYGLGILSSTYIFVVFIAPLVPCTDRWDVWTYFPSSDSWTTFFTNMNVCLWFFHFKIVVICHFGYKDGRTRINTYKNYLLSTSLVQLLFLQSFKIVFFLHLAFQKIFSTK